MEYKYFMNEAYRLAQEALDNGEIPVGAVVVEDGKIIGSGANRQLADSDPTAHAEIIALRSAGTYKNNFRLDGSDMYVTIEPCNMCKEAIRRARIKTVYYASYKAAPSTHETCYSELDVKAEDSSELMKEFFRKRR